MPGCGFGAPAALLSWGLSGSPGAGSMPRSWAQWPQRLEEGSGSAHRTCRTATTSCRPRWKACGHSCPRVGTASCPRDMARQVGARCFEVVGRVLLPGAGGGAWGWPAAQVVTSPSNLLCGRRGLPEARGLCDPQSPKGDGGG